MSSSTSVALTLALVPAARLILARVNVWRRQSAYEIRIDEEGVDPAIAVPLLRELRDALVAMAAVQVPGVTPVVGVHLERAMPAAAVACRVGPHVVSVYIGRGSMPGQTANDLADAIAYIIRRL